MACKGVPYARIDSILNLSLCLSSTIGRAVNADSMARASQLYLTFRPEAKVGIIRYLDVFDEGFGGLVRRTMVIGASDVVVLIWRSR